MSKVIAIIPARGGSKRIPKKNIKIFHGLPLIAYSIQTALKSKLFDEVIVSTDDEEIANIAKKYGATVPFIRSKELSDDFTGTSAVSKNVVEFFENNSEKIELYCTIYATAPFLKVEFLKEGFERLKNSNAVNAFSCTSFGYPIQRAFKITKESRCQMFEPKYSSFRSQDLEEAFQDAGQFYWTNRKRERTTKSHITFSEISIPIVIPRFLVQDIDTLEDFKRAEIMYEVLKQNGEI